MTILEAENFYEEDLKKYNLNSNNDFIKYLKDKRVEGYNSFDIEYMKQLIDSITIWYEIKYPDAYYEENDGTINFNHNGLSSIAEYLNYDQLRYRLDDTPLFILECGYRTCGWSQEDICDKDGNIIDLDPILFMFLNQKVQDNKYYLHDSLHVQFNQKTGIVDKYTLEQLNLSVLDNIKIDDLLQVLKQNNQYDYKEVKNCVDTHNNDLQLRSILLQLTALKILYSPNTIPEYGYKRAKQFIEEFNEYIPALNLTTAEIDEIINRDYKTQKITSRSLIKKLFKTR